MPWVLPPDIAKQGYAAFGRRDIRAARPPCRRRGMEVPGRVRQPARLTAEASRASSRWPSSSAGWAEAGIRSGVRSRASSSRAPAMSRRLGRTSGRARPDGKVHEIDGCRSSAGRTAARSAAWSARRNGRAARRQVGCRRLRGLGPLSRICGSAPPGRPPPASPRQARSDARRRRSSPRQRRADPRARRRCRRPAAADRACVGSSGASSGRCCTAARSRREWIPRRTAGGRRAACGQLDDRRRPSGASAAPAALHRLAKAQLGRAAPGAKSAVTSTRLSRSTGCAFGISRRGLLGGRGVELTGGHALHQRLGAGRWSPRP